MLRNQLLWILLLTAYSDSSETPTLGGCALLPLELEKFSPLVS